MSRRCRSRSRRRARPPAQDGTRSARGQPSIIKNAKAYASLGVKTLIISSNTSDPREARSALEMIAREVSPALAG